MPGNQTNTTHGNPLALDRRNAAEELWAGAAPHDIFTCRAELRGSFESLRDAAELERLGETSLALGIRMDAPYSALVAFALDAECELTYAVKTNLLEAINPPEGSVISHMLRAALAAEARRRGFSAVSLSAAPPPLASARHLKRKWSDLLQEESPEHASEFLDLARTHDTHLRGPINAQWQVVTLMRMEMLEALLVGCARPSRDSFEYRQKQAAAAELLPRLAFGRELARVMITSALDVEWSHMQRFSADRDIDDVNR